VKCCDTITRGNYTAHKRTEKHTKLHEGGSIEQEDPEIYKNRQIEKVMNYHENRNKPILEGGFTLYNGKRYTEEQFETLRAKTRTRDIENRHTERTQNKPITTREELIRNKMRQNKPTPLIDRIDEKTQDAIYEIYEKAKNIYINLNPRDFESKRRVKIDLNMFEKLLDGEIYEKTSQLIKMIEYYENLD
jgi:hypothetical protein